MGPPWKTRSTVADDAVTFGSSLTEQHRQFKLHLVAQVQQPANGSIIFIFMSL
jgi:hypothetical protein